ncbi:MAG: cupin domain-containing protein [Actinobacteria bacterium]|nr:cupin domain-containing protein [Actinomycetota bacterium]
MKRKLMATVSVVLAVLGVTMATVLPSGAQTEPPPIAVELLTPRGEFTDDVGLKVHYRLDGTTRRRVIKLKDASRTAVARITVQPGARFPWHTHPGPVLVNVAQGELVYVRANDCVERPYPTGTAFVDPGKKAVHTAFNPTNGVTVVYATFYDVPETGPLTITEGVEAPDDCSMKVGSHSH